MPESMMGRVRQKGTQWLLVAFVLLAAGLLIHPVRAQQASRYALTAALVERGTVILDDYDDVLGIDRAVRDGHIYSDKAPGQPFLATPFFALGKVVGLEDATILKVDHNYGVWWVTLWSSVVPAAVLVMLVYRRGKEVAEPHAMFGALAVFVGTLLLPFSTLLFGHVMAATLLYASFICLVRQQRSAGLLGLAGLLAGLAVVVEYTAILGVLVLGSYALVQYRRSAVVFALGGLLPAIGLLAYNAVAFDAPLTLSYQFSAFTSETETARPLLDMFTATTADNTRRLLTDGRGIMLATPVVVVAMVAAASRLRKGMQVDALFAIIMIGVFLLLPLFWGNPWGGDSPGPRYLTPALPFLGIPIAWARSRWRLVTFIALGISCLTMIAATITDPLLHRDDPAGLRSWVQLLLDGRTADTIPSITWGFWGWMVHGGLLVLALVALLRLVSRDRWEADRARQQ